jgi:hypothetical protein
MSEPVARHRPMIDLDEFERRLRRPSVAPPQSEEDPLAELARLVGNEHDPYQDVFDARPQQKPPLQPLQKQPLQNRPQERAQPRPQPELRVARPDLQPVRAQERPVPERLLQERGRDDWPAVGGVRAESAGFQNNAAPTQRVQTQRPAASPPPAGLDRGFVAERPAFLQQASRVEKPRVEAPSISTRGQAGAAQRGRGLDMNGAAARALGGNFAAIEAGLRGSIQPDYDDAEAEAYPQDYRADEQQGQHYQSRGYQSPNHQFQSDQFQQDEFQHEQSRFHSAEQQFEDDDDHWLDIAQASQSSGVGAQFAESPRSRRLLYVTAAIILVGMGGIGATFALKRTPESPQQIAMIKAGTLPTKIAAPTPIQSASAKAAMQDASVLETTPQPPPIGVINRTEEPVDLGHTAGASAVASDAGGAASVPVPAPPPVAEGSHAASAQSAEGGVAGTQVAAATNEVFGLSGMIQAKKVKTVTVRPDGTVVSDDAAPQAPVASADAGPQTAAPQADATQDTASTGALPPTPIADAEAGAGSDSGAGSAPAAAAVDEPPVSHAEASHAKPSHAGSSHAESSHAESRAKPVKVADLGNDEEASVGSGAGGFAVQLAAPASEAEARRALTQFVHKYGSLLGSRHLKFHRAKVGGKSVYRVRVGGLTKEGATQLCQNLQSKGGSCFVARD